MRAYPKVSRRALGKTTEYGKRDLPLDGKRTHNNRRMEPVMGPHKNKGICFPVLWQTHEMNKFTN